jgi:hypothetical protein
MKSVLSTNALTASDINAILNNDAMAIRIPEFLTANEVNDVIDGIKSIGVEYYLGDTKSGTMERKGKIGPNLYRFKDDIDAYFQRLEDYEQDAKPALFSRVDVPSRFRDLIQGAVAQPCEVLRATAEQGPLADCTVRALPSAPPHNDWISRELPHFSAFDGLLDQFAWNVYLSVGESGGETLIYDTTDPQVAVSMAHASASLKPVIGELILFRSRNVHAVNATKGDRLTVSGFWGPYSDGNIRYWV